MAETRPTALNQTAIALVRRWIDGNSRWLVLYEESNRGHQLVEADRIENESLRESIDREVAWELGVRRKKDYIVSSVPRLHLELPVLNCAGVEQERFDVIEFYLVELFGQQVHQTLDQNDRVRWWSVEELLTTGMSEGLNSRHRDLLRIADFLHEDRTYE